MNVLIFEYITGGGLVGEDLPASLVKEGELMLNALAHDLSETSNVQVSVLRDYRLKITESKVTEYTANKERGYAEIIMALENNIDALLIVAPESDGLLAELCKEFSHRDFILLNSTTDCIELTSDKLKTYNHLAQYGVTQIPTYEINDINLIESENIIIKPKDGAGCENVHLINKKYKTNILAELLTKNDFIAQPYIQGRNASLSLLCWDGECRVLSANIQNITSNEKCLELDGCLVNGLSRDSFIYFSAELIKAFTGLRGYVGVDVVIREDQIILVELNPRLTTSYVGLKSACGFNPAALILETFLEKKLPYFEISHDSSVLVEVNNEYAA
jgi:predicted ATP-grasp superfamily ATP-dependent carboligase